MDSKAASASRLSRKRNSAAISDGETSATAGQKQGIEAKSSSKRRAVKASADKENGASSSGRAKKATKAKKPARGIADDSVLVMDDSVADNHSSTAHTKPSAPIDLDDHGAGSSSSTAARWSPGSTTKDDGADEQECADLLAEQPTTTSDEQLQARVRELEAELRSTRESLKAKDGLVTSQHAAFEELQSSCACQICLELVWRPCVLAPCGHIFCIRCLQSWFTKPLDSEAAPPANFSEEGRQRYLASRTLKRKKICPSCRTELACAPVEIWLVREILEKVQGALKLHPSDNDLPAASQEETQKKKGDDLPAASKIWTSIFEASGPRRLIFDEVDRVPRCGACASEVDDGVCTNPSCAIEYDSDMPELRHRRGEEWESEDYSSEFTEDGYAWESYGNHRAAVERARLFEDEIGFGAGRAAGRFPNDGLAYRRLYLDGFPDEDDEDDDEDYHSSEEDDFLPGPRRAHASANDPIQITDDSEGESPRVSLRDDAHGPGAGRRLQRSAFLDDEAEDDETDEEDEDDDFIDDDDESDLGELDEEDDVDLDTRPSSASAAPKTGAFTDAATRSRARRIIQDSDEDDD